MCPVGQEAKESYKDNNNKSLLPSVTPSKALSEPGRRTSGQARLAAGQVVISFLVAGSHPAYAGQRHIIDRFSEVSPK